MQAGRPAQPSAADSPSSSHPRKGFCEASRAFRFLRCTAARVAPEGVPGQAHIHEPRGSAPRERDHRGGDHPVPSRTRQLSPPSPRVLQRKAAGGQGVALAEGAFLHARERPRRPAGPAGGSGPPAGPSCVPGRLCARAPFRARGHAACGLVLCFGGAFSCMRGLSSFRGAHALSAALCIYKGRRRNAICGRCWNAKREAAERRASWQAANLRASRRWVAASLLVSLRVTLLRVFLSFIR